MYENKNICVVIPAYNEESQIVKVVESMPDWVDSMAIVNDCSTDRTKQTVEELKSRHPSIVLINHTENQGVGGAIATGYLWARDHKFDAAVVMAGDAQMDPEDLPAILHPVVSCQADYAKGNRLFTGEAYREIPKIRYFGNSVLSLLTKIAAGYWHVADSQSGYTAIGTRALQLIDWAKMYKRYGQPNDLLVRLNVYDLKVRDVPVKPVYNVGEVSGIKLDHVAFTIPWLLLRLFLWRMKEKYIIRNFHPLIFFYLAGFLFLVASIVLFGRVFLLWHLNGRIPPINALAAFFSFTSSSLFTLFAMWFDREENRDLR